jgi:large subunit ribosomal protein L13Ae
VGWQYKAIVSKLEDKRKLRSATFYEKKKADLKLKEKAAKNVAGKLEKFNKILQQYGHA